MRRRVRRHRGSGDDGAALVEFALIAMPLFLILFATIEFGWAFFQLNDVRHGAREGLRLAAVNAPVTPDDTSWGTDGQRLAQAACERMDQSDGATVTITLVEADGESGFETGDEVEIDVRKPLDQLTTVFAPVLDPVVLSETVSTRLEQDPDGIATTTTWTCA